MRSEIFHTPLRGFWVGPVVPPPKLVRLSVENDEGQKWRKA